MDFQFFPTPKALAQKMWDKFQNKEFARVLEPSAGDGDLILARTEFSEFSDRWQNNKHNRAKVDVCEIDPRHHARLQELGMNVVGYDFLQLTSASTYGHIILNPPFANGHLHVLHAFDLLWDGEIVGLLNAETIRNCALSKERQYLVDLIEKHGSVEFVQDAFLGDEVHRETAVEVAIVYLKKVAPEMDYFQNVFDGLTKDETTAADLAGDVADAREVALPRTVIELQVRTFNEAVNAWRETYKQQSLAMRYTSRLGETLANKLNNKSSDRNAYGAEWVRNSLASKYGELRDRAWASILEGSDLDAKLSRSAREKLRAEFAVIKQMEFSVRNVHGFLAGIMESATEIQLGMVDGVFDEIVRYHDENVCYYRGWKSNSRHRTAGMRIKTTRFILPHFPQSYGSSIAYDKLERLRDIDLVFALLDGKSVPEVSLVSVFSQEETVADLRAAQRVDSTYFSVRWYKGIGTIHFYAKRKDLVERLNRIVGARRQWLPEEPHQEAKGFWENYAKSEQFDTELRKAMTKYRSGWDSPLAIVSGRHSKDEEGFEQLRRAETQVQEALAEVQAKHGVDADLMIGGQRLLLAA